MGGAPSLRHGAGRIRAPSAPAPTALVPHPHSADRTDAAPRRLAASALLLAHLAGCGPAEEPRPQPGPAAAFRDVTAEVGVDFVHVAGDEGNYYFPEIMGAGVGLLDIEGDGDLDVYLVQGGRVPVGGPPGPDAPRNGLYRNDLSADGRLTFTDVTDASATGDRGYGMGCAVGDYDGDGDPDLYVTNYGPNVLYRNDGGGRFTDVTATAGVDDPRWTVSATFLDYDGDGDLDLFHVNYVAFADDVLRECRTTAGDREYCTPLAYRAQSDVLYRNNGDGTFSDVTVEAGLDGTPSSGLGVLATDFDDDGNADLYVANDAMANQLWMNRGGRFEETGLTAGAALNGDGAAEAGMGVTAGDIDDDGDEDLFVAHLFGETNTLYLNMGRGLFMDRTPRAGLAGPSRRMTGFGTRFLDYDNDGLLDVVVVNGGVAKVETQLADPWPYKMANQLFRGVPGGRFEDVTAAAGPAFAVLESSRGVAVGDLDLDGGLDLVVTNCNGRARVLRNEVGARNHWLRVALVPSGGTAVGAVVELHRGDAMPRTRRAHGDGSYASASDDRVTFGLGSDDAPVDLLVRWPGGQRELFSGLAVDREHVLRQGAGGEER